MLKDLTAPLQDGDSLELLKFDASSAREVFWHTSSHILAQAVKTLYPKARLAIGPAIDNGFYYDFDMEETLSPADFEKIEKKMAEIVESRLPLSRRELSKSDAIQEFSAKGEKYKVELIQALADGETVSVYSQGDFTDLCRGPHLPDTGMVRAVKLLSVAGAYWRGDSKNAMLQRLYAISFPDRKQLDEHLRLLEEAKRRDHRELNKSLDLFSFHDEGLGFPFFHPNGMVLYNALMDYMRGELCKRGYGEIRTPIILNEELWRTSGHYDNFRENMYFTEIDEKMNAVKPMNCPGGLLIYKSSLHSYKDLPLRMAEFGLVHRHELSGVLHGLFRVRSFTQDDAHVFCTRDQLTREVLSIVDFTLDVYRVMGFQDVEVFIATRPLKAMGSDEDWELATQSLKDALSQKGLVYKIKQGEGAFYGPKIEFNIKDCLKRNWQCGTVQVDFSMPKRFNLEYIGEDGASHTPVMVHRAILGSIERFLGVLIEHYAGDFPLWLSPNQAIILPVTEKQLEYAKQVQATLFDAGIRVSLDSRSEKIGKKIRDAELARVPFMLIVGDKEAQAGTVSVRRRRVGDLGAQPIASLITEMQQEIVTRALPPSQKTGDEK